MSRPSGTDVAEIAGSTPRARRRFNSFHDFLNQLEAKRVVNKILIANNGLAAVKGINSIRQWCFSHLDIDMAKNCIEFEAMATPDDLSVDAEFCHLAEHYVEVPGGSNKNNYANVDLIVQTAVQQRCDAVYPGWGHASENPALPRELLKRTGGRVVFLGPGETAMFALGDKIASTIIAQSFGVPCVDWSGAHVRIPSGSPPGVVPQSLHNQAFVHTLEECIAACERVGYPVMLKASEGGGGKGIRRVTRLAEVAGCYSAVRDEVAGCHIFVMKMLSNVRHLEVQLLADAYGECIAVRTRDCSVQRRHQKIIEEGPVVGVDPSIVDEMEKAAIRMAKAVGYIGLGTVEYMYDRDTGKYSFLELNPRVQVEHPVSELISGVNLPAALLCVCLGIPLHRIPEVRKMYGEADRYGTSRINFDTTTPLPPKGHAIAVRITAEDAEEGFRPTTGAIEEISFKDSVDCWGYFSVGHGRGGVHQYADSQFGHIFAHSATREEARRAMILALSSLVVRGEIRYSTPFVVGLLERQEFIESKVHTAWLDGILAGSMVRPSERFIFQALAVGAVSRLCRQNKNNEQDYLKALAAGHTPSTHYLDAHRTDTFIVESKKYTIHSGMLSPRLFALVLNGSTLLVHFRELQSSGALQLNLGNKNVVAHVEEEAIGCRINFSNRTIVLTADADPTKLRASVSGKLVRYLARNGDHITAGSPYCEIEVMKMIYPLICNVTGTLTLRAAPGATLQAGKLLAEIAPDDPSAVARAEADLSSTWPTALMSSAGSPNYPTAMSSSGNEGGASASATSSSAAASTSSTSSAAAVSSGNSGGGGVHARTFSNFGDSSSSVLSSFPNNNGNNGNNASGDAANLFPRSEQEEADAMAASADSASRARSGVKMLYTMLQGYHPSGTAAKFCPLNTRIEQYLDDLSSLGIFSVTLNSLGLPFMTFPEEADLHQITATASSPSSSPKSSKQNQLSLAEIGKSTSPIQKLLFVLQFLLNSFLAIEKLFDGQSRAATLEMLRAKHEGDLKKVFEIDFVHHQKHRVDVAKKLLQVLGEDRVLLCKSIDLLKAITNLRSASTSSIVLQARFLLRNAQGPTFEERKAQLREQLEQGQVIVKTTAISMELACAVLFDPATPNTLPAMLEFILRRAYYGEADIVNYDIFRSANDWRFRFSLSASQSATDVVLASDDSDAAARSAGARHGGAGHVFAGFSVFPIHKVRLADAGYGIVIVEDRYLDMSLKKFGDAVAGSISQQLTNSRDKTVYGLVFAKCRADAKIQDLCEEYRTAINKVDSFHRISAGVFLFYVTVIAYGAPNGPYFFTYSRQLISTAEGSGVSAADDPNVVVNATGQLVSNRHSAVDLASSSWTPRTMEPIGVASTPLGSPNQERDPTGSQQQKGGGGVSPILEEFAQRKFEFIEDRMLRNVFAPTAGRLETRRLEKHYNVHLIPQFGNRKIHLYIATPKQTQTQSQQAQAAKPSSAVSFPSTASPTTGATKSTVSSPRASGGAGAAGGENRRLFVRCFFSPADLMMQPWDALTDVEAGQIMSNVISAVELAFADSSFVLTKLNHLFVNLVEISVDLHNIRALIHSISTSFGERLKHLHFVEVEISFRIPVFADPNDRKSAVLGTVPCRIFASNVTGYAVTVAMFAEILRGDGHTELCPLQTPEDVEQYVRRGRLDFAGEFQTEEGTSSSSSSSPSGSDTDNAGKDETNAKQHQPRRQTPQVHFDVSGELAKLPQRDSIAEIVDDTSPSASVNKSASGTIAAQERSPSTTVVTFAHRPVAADSRGWGVQDDSRSLPTVMSLEHVDKADSNSDQRSTSQMRGSASRRRGSVSALHGGNASMTESLIEQLKRTLSTTTGGGGGISGGASSSSLGGNNRNNRSAQRTRGLIDVHASNVALEASEAYPPLTVTQLRRLQAQSTRTTYVHDWLILLEVAARRSWKKFRSARGCSTPESGAEGVPQIPAQTVISCQLALPSASSPKQQQQQQQVLSSKPSPSTVETVIEVSVDAKQTCGVVAWKCDILLPSRYDARTGETAPTTVVVLANDITWENGAFSIHEDRLFAAVSAYARENKFPFVYLSANSGARIGLATEVQSRFKAALKESGGDATLDYIYLTKQDLDDLEKLNVRVVTEAIQVISTAASSAMPSPCSATSSQFSVSAATTASTLLAATGNGGNGVATTTSTTTTTETRYKIIDVIGSSKDPIGVENLQGSALLAGQMSLNYETVPTLSIVSGRSVGIGAYLNRLGRRVIQVQGAPIILTGFQAINRLLGKEVYTSQDQLGGNDIMQPNGVAHWGPQDDLAAVSCALRWLYLVGASFENASSDPLMQQQQQQASSAFSVPHVAQRFSDHWDRDVTFTPHQATPYDPRLLIDVPHIADQQQQQTSSSSSTSSSASSTGLGTENTQQQQQNLSASVLLSSSTASSAIRTLGIFDKGSFQESLARWAPTVVVGRATLGGIPIGIIAVETRTMTKIDPADPADLESRASVIKQAGQVWFPDSSRKTADALEDFRHEGLPCFVIANWRGFSGGMRDMFDEVLKFGASIVDNLRVYDQPVIIYIPPFGELRGGSWVVLDPVINHNSCVEMFADPLARGGILEPAGIVNVKFKESDVRNLWRRSREAAVRESILVSRLQATLSSSQQVLSGDTVSPTFVSASSSPSAPSTTAKESSAGGDAGATAMTRAPTITTAMTPATSGLQQQQQQASSAQQSNIDAQLRKIEESERALFTDIAVTFADLHDTPGRMLAVQCIADIVPLRDARRFFYWKLRRMMLESAMARSLMKRNLPTVKTMTDAMQTIRRLVAALPAISDSQSSAADEVSPSSSAGSTNHGCARASTKRISEAIQAEQSRVQVLESTTCFEAIKRECTQTQLTALLQSLKQLRASSATSSSNNSNNFEQIEALLAATFHQ